MDEEDSRKDESKQSRVWLCLEGLGLEVELPVLADRIERVEENEKSKIIPVCIFLYWYF